MQEEGIDDCLVFVNEDDRLKSTANDLGLSELNIGDGSNKPSDEGSASNLLSGSA